MFSELTRLASEAARSPLGSSSFPSSAEAAALLSSALRSSTTVPLTSSSAFGEPPLASPSQHEKIDADGPFGPSTLGAWLASPGPHIEIPSEFLSSHSPPHSPLSSSPLTASGPRAAARASASVSAALQGSFGLPAASLHGDGWVSPLSPAYLADGLRESGATWMQAVSPGRDTAATAGLEGADASPPSPRPAHLSEEMQNAHPPLPVASPLVPIPTVSEVFSEGEEGGDRGLPTPRLGARAETEIGGSRGPAFPGADSPSSAARRVFSGASEGGQAPAGRTRPNLQVLEPPHREECSPLSPHWRAVHGILAPTSNPADSRLPEEGHGEVTDGSASG